MVTEHTGTAHEAGSGLVSRWAARLPGGLLLAVSLALVFAAWPRLHASLLYLPVDTALSRYFETRDIPGVQLEALSRRAAEVIAIRPHHRYWYGLSLLRYLQAIDPGTPRWEREPSLRRSLTAGTEALRRSPVNPYAWYQVAEVRHALGAPAPEVVTALEMSLLTGRYEPNLLVLRLELGAHYRSQLDESQRAQLSDQAGLAIRQRRSQLRTALQTGRLSLAALAQLTPPGLESELAALEQGLVPAP